ncbi:MAG: hypothetical protein QM541_06170 [Flavobacterium sp.]|nr:hypothetical protein [Flavobacterium sp.]
MTASQCKVDNHSKIVLNITSSCHWDMHDSLSASLGRAAYSYKFNSNGHCTYLFYDKKRKRNKYDDDDVVTNGKWEIKGDSVIVIRGVIRDILRYSEDTLLLQNFINKKMDTLVKNCN